MRFAAECFWPRLRCSLFTDPLARDGDISGGGVDGIPMKITGGSTVVYDNKMSTGDTMSSGNTQNLEKLAPGEHRQEAIAAAREALAMAASGKLEGADVAPLFEVLHAYGDTSVLTDLMQAAKQWNYYSAIALAQLPDGAGIPSLIEMAQGKSGGSLNALEMLTQLSAQYPEARAALLEQAGKISPNVWPYLTPLLAGDLYHYQDSALDNPLLGEGKRSNSAHVVMGNQNFYTAPAAEILAPDEIKRRLALIDELQTVTSDPAALKALQQARDLLARRHPQTVAVSP